MVLTHARNYRSEDIRQSKKRWRDDLCVVSLLIGWDGARPSLFGSQATRLPLQMEPNGTPQPTPRHIGSEAAYLAG